MDKRVQPLALMTMLACCLRCGGDMVDAPVDASNPQRAGGSSATPNVSDGGAGVALGGSGGSVTQRAVGGSSSTIAGGMPGVGGSTAISTGGTSVVPAPACSPQLNLLSGNLGADGNWIGGIASSPIDNPCGLQGLIYIFGDSGLDNTPGTEDDTCPFMDQSVSPCSNGRCCVKGTTHKWPLNPAEDYREDHTASVWGCGIGMSLSDPGTGNGTLPYAGPSKGFTVKLSGELNGQTIRIGYTQLATPSTAPYRQYSALGDARSVGFTDVECPIWYSVAGCVMPGPNPHALQVWVTGGDVFGDFEMCIDAVSPML